MSLDCEEMNRRLAVVRMIAFDVDGVLTDGRLRIDSAGKETKSFHVRDGLGIVLAQRTGLLIALVSGRRSAAVDRRARDLGIPADLVVAGSLDKGAAIRDLRARLSLARDAIAFVGDDLNDIPAFAEAGLSVAVADAAPEVRERADLVTSLAGGSGAAREVIERVLTARHEWAAGMEAYLEMLRESAPEARAPSPQ